MRGYLKGSVARTVLIKAALIMAFAAGGTAVAQDAETVAEEDNGDEIVIIGRAQEFYRVGESSLATKTPTAILDTPQSVQVLTNQLIEDQAARDTTDLYRSISGVTFFSYSGIVARGFRQDEIRYDGVRGDPFAGFSVPQLFNIERIEVLKGVSGMLYGGGEPGGLINYVTKRPEYDHSGEVEVTLGDRGLWGVSGDITGPVAGRDDIAFRLGGFYEEINDFRNNAGEETGILTAQGAWKPGPATELVASLEYYDINFPGNRLRGVPTDDDGNFLTDISWNTNEATDFLALESTIGQLTLTHEFADNLSLRLIGRIVDNEEQQQYHESRGPAAPGSTLYLREFRDQFRTSKESSITADLVWQETLAGMEHTVLVGGDYFDTEATFRARTARQANPLGTDLGTVQPLDLIDPVYGNSGFLLLQDELDMIPWRRSETSGERYGLYVQDQVEITEKFHLIGGARFDSFEETDAISGDSADDEAVSYRAGAVFKPVPPVSLYLSYGEGFEPQGITDPEDGGPFDPEESQQVEAGVKAELFDGRILATAAVYDIVKSNVLVANPDPAAGTGGVPNIVQIGEVTSQGLELDAVGDITDLWTFQVNYAFNETKITGGAPGSISNAVGDGFANAPEHAFGLWTRYELPTLNSAIAGGVDYVGERISISGQDVQAYTVYDASWITNFDNGWQGQVNVRNLFDEEYAASGFIERTGHFPGAPRSVVVQVSKKF